MSAAGAISVVIAARDAERYLAEAVQSALAQQPAPLEVIVVDDGSADATAAVAEQAGARVLRRPPEGAGAARNAGARAAGGGLLAFLDADDRFTEGRFALLAPALEREPSLDGVLGAMRSFISPDRLAELRGRVRCPSEAQRGAVAGVMLIRTAAFLATGGFDESLGGAEVIDWFHRARAAGLRFASLPDVVLERRIHTDNMTRSAAARRAYVEVARAAVLRGRQPGGS